MIRFHFFLALLLSGPLSGRTESAVTDPFDLSIGIAAKFIAVEPGIFEMGSPSGGGTPHLVRLTRGFEMQATELTQRQYFMVMRENPSQIREDCDAGNAWKQGGQALCLSHPVESVTWMDIQEFIARLNAMQERHVYRLPTEAEWEYVARDGIPSRFSHPYGDETDLERHAWYRPNSNGRTHAVATKKANRQGFYDMHGNVAEWVADYHGDFASDPVTDPQGPGEGSRRVVRGGSRFTYAPWLSSCREHHDPLDRSNAVGFRLVRSRR